MPATTLRPNQGFTTKATVTRGDTQLVSWIIFSGHNSDASNILEIHPKIGLELDHVFSVEGKFRLAAYHKEIQTKEDYQSTAELKHVDVEVKYNQLDGAKLLPKNPANFVSGDTLRKNFPCIFEAKFLINPASSDELSRLKFSLSDGSRNTLHEGSQAGSIFTFTPRNSNAKYTLTATYTDEFGTVSTQSFSGTSKALSVKDITHGEQVVRPGTSMSFSVTKTQFNFSVKNDSDLPENDSIKWNLDKVLIGTGRTINIPGSRLMQKKKYHIEAFVTSAIGKTTGTNTDGINNDWHFEVKDNIVEKIKIVKSPKMGTAGEFEIEETTFKNYDPIKDGAISWRISGPETGTGSEAKFSKSFSLLGEYTISCSLGGRPCKEPLKINIIEPMVTVEKCKWIDKDSGSGNIIKQAGLNQEISVFVSGNGLDNEVITLNIYDDDSTGNNIVFTNTFKTTEKHKTGFYFPLTITQEIVDKIKEHGFADRGDLYFNLVRNGAETPIKNGDKKLGEFLRVTLEPQIINAYFCDANDTEQVFSSPLNGALYFKIYAINMVDKKVEINFLTESDAYWTWDDELKIGKWDDIKDKFKDEKIRDTKTATFDKKGEILVPVDLSKMGKPKNFIRLNAMVKILKDEETTEKQEEKGFYIKHTDLAILFPGATLPTMVENKGAVKVGRAEIDGGEKEHKCPRCEEEITLKHIEDCFGILSTAKTYRSEVVKYLNQYIKQRKNTDRPIHLDTCLRKAHFFAQVGAETLGINPDWIVETDVVPYKVGNITVGLFGDRATRLINSGNLETYCRERPQKKLLNFLYAAENGHGNGNGSESSGDGYKFRGRGLKQLTGRGNYKNASETLKEIFPDEYVDLEAQPDKVKEIKYAVLSAIAYWEKHEIWKTADTIKESTEENTKKIRRRVNGGTAGWKDAKKYFESGINAFKVNECEKDKVQVQSQEGQHEYYIYTTGKIQHITGKEKKHAYYVEVGQNKFKLLHVLNENLHGVVKIPDSGTGYARYGGVDAGGKSGTETVGAGDHYVLPKTAAALFGIINETHEKGWEIHLGDMSSENGSDPWQVNFDHHAGHGHNGNRKGLDIDFRYLNKSGVSFHGLNTSADFDKDKNKTVFSLAYKYGFRKNYCTNVNAVFGENLPGVSNVSNHKDHGHIGLSDINLEEVISVNITKI